MLDIFQYDMSRFDTTCANVKRLTVRAALDDTDPAPEKEGAWFGDRTLLKAHRPRNAVFLRVLTSFVQSMGGSSRDTFGYAGCCRCRFANPVLCPASLIWR